jgi:hypothetical protein
MLLKKLKMKCSVVPQAGINGTQPCFRARADDALLKGQA